MTSAVSRFLREPLLHFLLLGGLIFVANAVINRSGEEGDADQRISITAGVIERLREGYRRQNGRAPDVAEVKGLIDAFIKEEILYREALGLGLDRDDTIVRRRLAQKMEFLTADMAEAAPPSEETIQAFFAARSDHYAEPARATFRHLYFAERRGEAAEADALAALKALIAGADPDTLGDGFLHGFDFEQRSPDDIAALFGREFAEQIPRLPLATWSGPIASSYGLHLVQLQAVTPRTAVALEQVRERVERDYAEDLRQRTNESLLEQLRARYVIDIDQAALDAVANQP